MVEFTKRGTKKLIELLKARFPSHMRSAQYEVRDNVLIITRIKSFSNNYSDKNEMIATSFGFFSQILTTDLIETVQSNYDIATKYRPKSHHYYVIWHEDEDISLFSCLFKKPFFFFATDQLLTKKKMYIPIFTNQSDFLFFTSFMNKMKNDSTFVTDNRPPALTKLLKTLGSYEEVRNALDIGEFNSAY